MCCNPYSLRIVLREGSKGVEMVIAFPGGFDLICVYWFSYRNRYKPVWVYISGVDP